MTLRKTSGLTRIQKTTPSIFRCITLIKKSVTMDVVCSANIARTRSISFGRGKIEGVEDR